MSKHLIFDNQVIIDLWLNRGAALITQELLDAATTAGIKRWMTAISLGLLENAAHQALVQQEQLSPSSPLSCQGEGAGGGVAVSSSLSSQEEGAGGGVTLAEAKQKVARYMTEWLTRVDILTNHGFEQAELYNNAANFQDAQIVAAARSLAGQQVCIVTENAHFDTLGQINTKTPAEAITWVRSEDTEPSKPLPFIDLTSQQAAIRPKLERGIEQILRHGQYILGPEVKELESRLAAYTETKHCITVSSGTDALLISLMALGIGPGDEVITTPFTFIATAEVLVLVGAKPVFVDIDITTCNMDVSLLEAKINTRTKAIMPVSLYGQPADMDAIKDIATRHHLPVIEDAAQSFGAEYRGRKSCNLSTIGCTSFFPSKPLGCYGDGGAIFTHDDSIAQACRELRVHGQSQRYLHTRIGVCARMDSLQCAVVLAKLERFPWELQQRQIIAKRYHQMLSVDGNESTTIRPLPWPQPDRTSVFAQYTVLTQERESLQAKLNAAYIPSAVHYPIPLTEQPAYQAGIDPSTTPNARVLAKQVLSLPMGPDLKLADQIRVVECILGK